MKKPLVFSILIMIFLNSCDFQHIVNIADNMRPILNNGDTLLYFDSLNNRIDTFGVNISKKYSTSDKTDYEEIDIIYKQLNSHCTFKKLSTIQYSTNLFYLDVNSFSLSLHYGISEYQLLSNFTINKTQYANVYKLISNNIPDTLPKTLYFSYQNGILRYDYSDGRHYDRISK